MFAKKIGENPIAECAERMIGAMSVKMLTEWRAGCG
jgi:hypothetical protein